MDIEGLILILFALGTLAVLSYIEFQRRDAREDFWDEVRRHIEGLGGRDVDRSPYRYDNTGNIRIDVTFRDPSGTVHQIMAYRPAQTSHTFWSQPPELLLADAPAALLFERPSTELPDAPPRAKAAPPVPARTYAGKEELLDALASPAVDERMSAIAAVATQPQPHSVVLQKVEELAVLDPSAAVRAAAAAALSIHAGRLG